MKVDILGTEYLLEERGQEDEKLKEMDGYCDPSIKMCVVDNMDREKEIYDQADLTVHKNAVKRHELIHAFLHESGMGPESPWARNEEMIDWFALQFPKMEKVFREVGCL